MAEEGFFNQQEVNMTYCNDEHAALHADGFIALAVAEEAAVAVGELMQGLPASLRCLQDQAVRAAASVALNVAEGSGRRGRERKRFGGARCGSTLSTTPAGARRWTCSTAGCATWPRWTGPR